MKRFLCVLLVFVLFVSCAFHNGIIGNAEENHYAPYSGTTQADWGYEPIAFLL